MGKDSEAYDAELIALQTAIVTWRKWSMDQSEKVLVIFEGRDAAGKDGTIRRIVEHLPLGTAGRIDARLPRAKAPTLFATYGNILPIGFALLLIAGALLPLARRSTSR